MTTVFMSERGQPDTVSAIQYPHSFRPLCSFFETQTKLAKNIVSKLLKKEYNFVRVCPILNF